jgi:hypothetical protein
LRLLSFLVTRTRAVVQDHEMRLVKKSLVTLRRVFFTFGSPRLKPCNGLIASHMSARFLIFLPSLQGVLVQRFALFLADHILLDGFAHDPVRRSVTRLGKPLKTLLH